MERKRTEKGCGYRGQDNFRAYDGKKQPRFRYHTSLAVPLNRTWSREQISQSPTQIVHFLIGKVLEKDERKSRRHRADIMTNRLKMWNTVVACFGKVLRMITGVFPASGGGGGVGSGGVVSLEDDDDVFCRTSKGVRHDSDVVTIDREYMRGWDH